MGMTLTLGQLHSTDLQFMMLTFAWPFPSPRLAWLLVCSDRYHYGCGVGPSCCASHSCREGFKGLPPALVYLFFAEW